MMSPDEMAKYLAVEEKKLQEVQKLNQVCDEYQEMLALEEKFPKVSTVPLETAILTIRETIENNLAEQDLLDALEEENEKMYDLEKNLQKVSNFLKEYGTPTTPLPLVYLRARTNTLRRILQADVSKAYK